tara:strand:- start:321 stop:545 length:225 start_codon:yes stop_codon:yes gene_type:complete
MNPKEKAHIQHCKQWFYATRHLPRHLLNSPGIIGDIIKAAFATKKEGFSRTEGPIVTKYIGSDIKQLLHEIQHH